MAYQRLQVSEGLAVIPSDTVPIPDPATKATSGTTNGAGSFSLIDSSKNFPTLGIQPGAIVYNISAQTAAFVTGLNPANPGSLLISVNTFGGGQDYVIYNAATKACTLYVGVGPAAVVVQMASQRDAANSDTVTFENVPSSAFLPILVTRVASTGTVATKIIALW